MIQIKFEVEEQEEMPLPIENENDRIKRLLSLKFFGNNLDNVVGGSTSDNNGNNVCGILKQKPLPELNGVVQKKVVPKKTKMKQLDNSTTDSVAVGLKSIKTEPVESSLSLTTQLNNSLNIQSLLRQNRIQNGWTTNEQSILIGTQQQQQSLLSTKIEPIVSENYQEVPLSLDLSSLIPNLDSEETFNCDTLEVPLLDQSFSSIPIGTQQQQQSSILPKIEPIILENHPEVLLSLDQSSYLILNSNSRESTTTTTTANCDTTNRKIFGPRAGFGRRAKLNVCYSVPKEPNQFTTATIQMNSGADNLESTNNDDNYSDQDFISDSGSIFGLDPSSASSSTAPPEAAVPLLVGKNPLPLGVPSLTSLEERKARNRERSLRYYHRNKANSMEQPVDPEIKAEKLRRSREYQRKVRQQRMASATPEQREQMRLKDLENSRRQREKETDEQRQRRLEQVRQYNRTVGKQRMERMKQYAQTVGKRRKQHLLVSATPEQLEQRRLKQLERYRRRMEKESEEQRKQRLEQKRQYYHTVVKQRRDQLLANATPEQREQIRLKESEKYRQHMENETEEQRKRRLENETEERRQRRLEQMRQYARTVAKRRKEQLLANATPEQRELIRVKKLESYRRRMENETKEQRKRRLERARQYHRTVAKRSKETGTTNNDTGRTEKGESQESEEIQKPKVDEQQSLKETIIDCETTNTLVESPKPGPSKLPDRSARRCQSNVKLYLEPSTSTDSD